MYSSFHEIHPLTCQARLKPWLHVTRLTLRYQRSWSRKKLSVMVNSNWTSGRRRGSENPGTLIHPSVSNRRL
ncbi:hypothetical protein PoB_007192300 [Plakobranchus ocellatus]|uniref:Uncharacterized protein n=1 Tax=Plakobranchus ocellatus TaxID=259542 RepID=A0AAV4DM85_9GAST|nr:hypothetical protein PoB_007192300 [Plakobranchus ocellatus]